MVTVEIAAVVGVKHRVETGETKPTRVPPHRLATYWRDQLREEIKDLVEKGILRHSKSPWSSPMVPVRKPDNTVRLCIDYRKLNSCTQPDPYELPLVEDLLHQVGEAQYLSKMDLNKGFYQIEMDERDIEKTAFCTAWGKFKFVKMPFGLPNAPATFQRYITDVLRGLELFTGAYRDDILVYSQTWEEHLQHLKETLERLRRHGLTVKPNKCSWGLAEVEYLGHRVGKGKIAILDHRVEAIRNYQQHKSKKNLRAFFGNHSILSRFCTSIG